MKITLPLVADITIAVLLCAGLVYLNSELGSANRDVKALRDANAALEGTVASLQKSIDGLQQKAKQQDAVIGADGTLQVLARSIAGGDMELSVKSLKVVSGGKTLVSLEANADQGGLLSVASADGTSAAEISSAAGMSKIGFKASTGPTATPVVHTATFGDEGYYIQKGPSDDENARTDGAGLRLTETGSNFFLAQNGAGNIAIATSSTDERAKISIWAEGDVKKLISLSLGDKDDPASVSLVGAPSGETLRLVPDRLSLLNKDGTGTLVAAQDENGGFLIVNDSSGSKRGILTAGSDGRGILSVFSNDKRSNTFRPEFNIQQSDSGQK
jgi:hypothetical protein